MRWIDADQIARHAPPLALVDAIAAQFRSSCETPLRHHHAIEVPGEPDGTLLLMPAWQPGHYLGVKVATVFPGNAARGEQAVNAAYLLLDGRSGKPLAMLDGAELTARRTAAASALAARYLARTDVHCMLMIGTGRLAPHLIRAHLAVRPSLDRILIWGRSAARAAQLAAELAGQGLPVSPTPDLDAALAEAELISCATLSAAPLVAGAAVAPGNHVDLVGGFTPDMREGDDELVRRAEVFVDTLAGALTEAGDIVVPLRAGLLRREALIDLATLCRGEHPGRTDPGSITLFKSVGTALEDLAAAVLVYEAMQDAQNIQVEVEKAIAESAAAISRE